VDEPATHVKKNNMGRTNAGIGAKGENAEGGVMELRGMNRLRRQVQQEIALIESGVEPRDKTTCLSQASN